MEDRLRHILKKFDPEARELDIRILEVVASDPETYVPVVERVIADIEGERKQT